MLSHLTPESESSYQPATDAAAAGAKPVLIADLVVLPDFPKCAKGQLIDVGGFVGVLVDIVNQSIKVRAEDGIVQSFNFNRLRTIYGPAPKPEPVPVMPSMTERPREVATNVRRVAAPAAPVEAAPAPKREVIAEPDFTAPIRPIGEFASRAQFPACAFGAHVDIDGFGGVVVEIVKQSLKVRSREGQTRSFNGPVLKNLYGSGVSPKLN